MTWFDCILTNGMSRLSSSTNQKLADVSIHINVVFKMAGDRIAIDRIAMIYRDWEHNSFIITGYRIYIQWSFDCLIVRLIVWLLDWFEGRLFFYLIINKHEFRTPCMSWATVLRKPDTRVVFVGEKGIWRHRSDPKTTAQRFPISLIECTPDTNSSWVVSRSP